MSQKTRGNATIAELIVTNFDPDSIRIGSGSSRESICQELSNKKFDKKINPRKYENHHCPESKISSTLEQKNTLPFQIE